MLPKYIAFTPKMMVKTLEKWHLSSKEWDIWLVSFGIDMLLVAYFGASGFTTDSSHLLSWAFPYLRNGSKYSVKAYPASWCGKIFCGIVAIGTSSFCCVAINKYWVWFALICSLIDFSLVVEYASP